MKAVERADELWPPLHVSGKHGLEPFNDLKLAINKVTIDDGQLRTHMGDFMTACTNADIAWFKASATIAQEHQSGDAIRRVRRQVRREEARPARARRICRALEVSGDTPRLVHG